MNNPWNFGFPAFPGSEGWMLEVEQKRPKQDKSSVRSSKAAVTWGVTISEWKEIIVQCPATDLCRMEKFKFIKILAAGENISMIIWIEFQQV